MKKTPPSETKQTPKKSCQYRKGLSWRQRFCAALAECPNVLHACEAAGVSRAKAYAEKSRFAVFRAQWATALREGIEKLETACWEKAMRRETTRTRTVAKDEQGRAVVTITTAETSDALAIFLLKAHHPEKYRETFRAQANPPPVEALKVETDVKRLPTEELEMIVAEAVARGALSADKLAMFAAAHPELAPNGGKPGNGAC